MIPFLKNRRFQIVAGICVLLLLAEVVLLVWAKGRLIGRERSLDRRFQRLGQLQNRGLFPSVGNVQSLRDRLKELEMQVGELRAGLARDPFLPETVDAADFSARAQKVVERFRQRAKQANIALPDSLEMGFSKYASGGAVPDQACVFRLCRQLRSVECLADVLLNSGVGSIDRLRRDEFEIAAEPPPEVPRRRSRRGALSPEVSAAPPPARASRHYAVERIGVEFTGKEDSVWRVLELLAASPCCMAVSEFSHNTQTAILSYDPAAVKEGTASEDETLRYLSEGILSGEGALARTERIIAGNEPVKVRLMVDVYDLTPEDDSRDAQ